MPSLIGLDRPSRSAGHRQQTDKQTDKHIAFYYEDIHAFYLGKKVKGTMLHVERRWDAHLLHIGL